jgi:hypothetical protein
MKPKRTEKEKKGKEKHRLTFEGAVLVLSEEQRAKCRQTLLAYEELITSGSPPWQVYRPEKDPVREKDLLWIEKERQLWTLLTERKIPSDQWVLKSEIEKLNEDNVALDESELSLIALNHWALYEAAKKQEFSDESLAETIIAEGMGSFFRTKSEERAKKIADRLAEMRLEFDRSSDLRLDGRVLVLASNLNRKEWENADQVAATQFEKNLYREGAAEFEYDETASEWQEEWQITFGSIWPKRWESTKTYLSDLREARRKRVRLSEELQLAALLNRNREVVAGMIMNQPLSLELMIVYLDRLPMWYMLTDFLSAQLVLGGTVMDVLVAYRRSKLDIHQDSDHERDEKLREEHVINNIHRADQEFYDHKHSWSQRIRNWFYRVKKKRNEPVGGFDGELPASEMELGDKLTLDELLVTFEKEQAAGRKQEDNSV